MAKKRWKLTQSQWQKIKPLLPKLKKSKRGGRPRKKPKRLITDRSYDSDPLRERLAGRGIELICPYRSNNKSCKYYDGRKLRCYKRRYKVERTFSWLGNFRRLVVRWDRDIVVYNAFFHIACLIITLRRL